MQHFLFYLYCVYYNFILKVVLVNTMSCSAILTCTITRLVRCCSACVLSFILMVWLFCHEFWVLMLCLHVGTRNTKNVNRTLPQQPPTPPLKPPTPAPQSVSPTQLAVPCRTATVAPDVGRRRLTGRWLAGLSAPGSTQQMQRHRR